MVINTAIYLLAAVFRSPFMVIVPQIWLVIAYWIMINAANLIGHCLLNYD